jgi:hypothetical protein
MARPLRFQYPGAVYHVMARGDGGKMVFETDVYTGAFTDPGHGPFRYLR